MNLYTVFSASYLGQKLELETNTKGSFVVDSINLHLGKIYQIVELLRVYGNHIKELKAETTDGES